MTHASNTLCDSIIHGYSRADALHDGVLHDLTDLARTAGIRWPVAIAAHAWADTVAWPDELGGETERARAWDVVWLARNAIRAAGTDGGNRIEFTVACTSATNPHPRQVLLAVHAGPGDQGEPVLTITSPADE